MERVSGLGFFHFIYFGKSNFRFQTLKNWNDAMRNVMEWCVMCDDLIFHGCRCGTSGYVTKTHTFNHCFIVELLTAAPVCLRFYSLNAQN